MYVVRKPTHSTVVKKLYGKVVSIQGKKPGYGEIEVWSSKDSVIPPDVTTSELEAAGLTKKGQGLTYTVVLTRDKKTVIVLKARK